MLDSIPTELRAPPITRIHRLFRIRVIVRKANELGSIKDEEVGRVLVEAKLSKESTIRSPDKLRRARDHLYNATILGLLIPNRRNKEFVYQPSPYGRLLSRYSLIDEFPKDTYEASLFIERLMRLKLTNAYDWRGTYKRMRVRPLYVILKLLSRQPLHIAQIHFSLALMRKGTIRENEKNFNQVIQNLHTEFIKSDKSNIKEFLEEFELDSKEIKADINRSTRPLIDWMRQCNLIFMDSNREWCYLSEYGQRALEIFENYVPIWYIDLPYDSRYCAAFILLSNLVKAGLVKRVNYREIFKAYESELQNFSEILNLLKSSPGVKFDFDFFYDIPVKCRSEVLRILMDMLNLTMPGLFSLNKLKQLLIELAHRNIDEISYSLQQTGYDQETQNLSRVLGITVPRKEWFQTTFEWAVCLQLRLLKLPAYPYNGEYEDIVKLPIARDNPDIVLRDKILSLVECKSKEEWGVKLKLTKRVEGEFYAYQKYGKLLNADSVLFVCEAKEIDKEKFLEPFQRIGRDLSKILITSSNYIISCIHDEERRRKLIECIKDPESQRVEDKVLII